MKDNFGRIVKYLRLSVTDLCSLRCVYCMPEAGIEKRAHDDILSVEEIGEIVGACASLGVTKVRLTGGEPLVRRGIVEICRAVSGTPGITEVCMTTNGLRLPELAPQLKDAGLHRVNLSLDTLDPEKYRRLTRIGALDQALWGLAAAEQYFGSVKINCVLMGGINDDEIPALIDLTRERDLQLRFIEMMPLGPCAGWPKERFLSCDAVLKAMPVLEPAGESGVASVYRVPGWRGTVGLIRPLSHKFCSECDRIRLTADGKLKPCLHSSQEIPLRGLHGAALANTLAAAIRLKPEQHRVDQSHPSESARPMNRIGG